MNTFLNSRRSSQWQSKRKVSLSLILFFPPQLRSRFEKTPLFLILLLRPTASFREFQTRMVACEDASRGFINYPPVRHLAVGPHRVG